MDEGDEYDESEIDKIVDGYWNSEGTHATGDLCQACQCVFEALELSEDRIVPPEIVALLQETRDCLDRMLFYKPKAEEHEFDIDDGEPPF